MAVGCWIVIVAVAVRLVCAWAAAVIVTTLLVGTVAGAVYKPFLSIVPVPVPLTCQFTKVLLRFEMLAVHCTCPFTVTVEAAQEADIVGVVDVVVVLPPPQEYSAASTGRSTKISRIRCKCVFWRHVSIFR